MRTPQILGDTRTLLTGRSSRGPEATEQMEYERPASIQKDGGNQHDLICHGNC